MKATPTMTAAEEAAFEAASREPGTLAYKTDIALARMAAECPDGVLPFGYAAMVAREMRGVRDHIFPSPLSEEATAREFIRMRRILRKLGLLESADCCSETAPTIHYTGQRFTCVCEKTWEWNAERRGWSEVL